MRAIRLAHRLAAAMLFFLAFACISYGAASAATSQGSPAALPQIPAGQIASIEPRVPPAAGQPCVVELFQDLAWPQMNISLPTNPTVNYAPPAACPPPWSKVILKVAIQSNRASVVDTVGIDLNNVRLFRGAIPRYSDISSWEVERDLTDYSALFKVPQTGVVWSTQNAQAYDLNDTYAFTGTAKLLFYPSTPATPAPHVPDAVIAVNQGGPVTLPTNIVRAYVDVEADYQGDPYSNTGNDNPFWYSCFSNASYGLFNSTIANDYAPGGTPYVTIFPPPEGCSGGNFREVHIGVDGTPAGIAPVFPLVIADLNWILSNDADQPITTLEMLNFKPYRVDLTPFAALLSAPGGHNITSDTEMVGVDDSGYAGTALLVYLDPNSTQVSGAITLNTLATESGAPTVTNTVAQHGATVVAGNIHTQEQRNFEIRGFVNTSWGRIDSTVHQTSHFSSQQVFNLVGLMIEPNLPSTPFDELYSQTISLISTVEQESYRKSGHRLISHDLTKTSYPLQMVYSMNTVNNDNGDSWGSGILQSTVTVKQKRVMDTDQYQADLGQFTTHAESGFYSHIQDGSAQPNPIWESSTTRDYRDNFGSCYRAKMKSDNGTITDITHGEGCPGDHNWVIWFAHPDGSPGSW